MKVRIINPPTEITEKSRGPDIGMHAMLERIKAEGWPDWLEVGLPELVPRNHIPLVWRWTDKQSVASYYARNNVPWIAGQNIFFDDFGNAVPIIQKYEYELIHSRSLLGVITDGSHYQDVIQFASRHTIDVHQAPYPPPRLIDPVSCDIDFLVYDKTIDRGNSPLASIVNALPGRVEYVVYGDYKQEDWFGLIANAGTVVYLADNDRYPVAMIEALSAGCDIIGAVRCCGPAIDCTGCMYSAVEYPYNAGEIAVAAQIHANPALADKEGQSALSEEWIQRFTARFLNAIDELRSLA